MGGVRAFLFDVGGVLTVSPVGPIVEFHQRYGLPPGLLVPLLVDPAGPLARLESGTLELDAFLELLAGTCTDAGYDVTAGVILDAMCAGLATHAPVLEAIEGLRGRYRLGCLTNNFRFDQLRPEARVDLHELFDVCVESWRVGVRKPDPRIYEVALRELGVPAEQTVFLDDLEENLPPARALGMRAFHVTTPEEVLAVIADVTAG